MQSAGCTVWSYVVLLRWPHSQPELHSSDAVALPMKLLFIFFWVSIFGAIRFALCTPPSESLLTSLSIFQPCPWNPSLLQSNRGALALSGGHKEAQKIVDSHRSTKLQYVQNGVIHLDQDSKMDRQAGLTVLCGRRACQPGEGVVLFQHKPAREIFSCYH